jgi:outer membrane protein assembly factor BamB
VYRRESLALRIAREPSAGVTFNFSKFCPPMVADGKLYVPTYDGRVDVYVLND